MRNAYHYSEGLALFELHIPESISFVSTLDRAAKVVLQQEAANRKSTGVNDLVWAFRLSFAGGIRLQCCTPRR